MKKLLAALIVFGMITLLVVACSNQNSTSNVTTPAVSTTPTPPVVPDAGGSCPSGRCSASGPSTTVHLGPTNFAQSSVTIAKGDFLTLVSDTAAVHHISNGSWVNGVAHPALEPGMPDVSYLQFDSVDQGWLVGPFNTAGTFHLYCTIHTGMNLTIIVQ
jgi:plastocyanin